MTELPRFSEELIEDLPYRLDVLNRLSGMHHRLAQHTDAWDTCYCETCLVVRGLCRELPEVEADVSLRLQQLEADQALERANWQETLATRSAQLEQEKAILQNEIQTLRARLAETVTFSSRTVEGYSQAAPSGQPEWMARLTPSKGEKA